MITLHLDENDFASVQVGDICRGIYNDIAGAYETATVDDDVQMAAGSSSQEGDGIGFSAKKGFFTSYFYIERMVINRKGECQFIYKLRSATTPHPCVFMKFAQYGSFTNAERRASKYESSINHYYKMILEGVSTWQIQSANIVSRSGYLGDMEVELADHTTRQLQGYGLYVQNNVYFGSAVVQLDPYTLEMLERDLAQYDVNLGEHVDMIVVDDTGNVIGGVYTETTEGGVTTREYRIHSVITVRKKNVLLTEALADAEAGTGTYKISFTPVGCTAMIENSTLYITGIDHVKDGVAGSGDDTDFDYDAMRAVNSCRVDLVIDCEGKTSIQKSIPIAIKHDSQPFVGADITNDFSAVSWNTETQAYIGLPITMDFKMWHNDEVLDIASVNDISVSPSITEMTVAKSIVENASGNKVAHIVISALPADLGLVTNLEITCAATYSGVRYERTLVHTINKSTDTNVYSLIPSVDEVIVNKNTGGLSSNSVDISVVCDSSDNKHFDVAYNQFGTHQLCICYKKFYTDGTSDADETEYTGTAVSINSGVERVSFYLYKKVGNTIDRTVLHDKEDVPVIANGLDGKGVEYIFITKADWDGTDEDKPSIETEDTSSTEFQRDNHCPYTDSEHTDQWTDEPTGVSTNARVEFYAQRKKINGVWQPFRDVKFWDRYVVDGVTPYVIDLSNEQSMVACNESGGVVGSYETSKLMLFYGQSYAFNDFAITITPTNITCNNSAVAFTLTAEQKAAAQAAGYFTLTPSAITADSATIAITATKGNIVLNAVYKVNKAYAGKNGVIYSLMPSLDTIRKNKSGSLVDQTLTLQVKKTVGAEATILTTAAQLSTEGLTLKYENASTESPVTITDAVSIATNTFVGTNGTWGKIILIKSNVIVDAERINVVSDGVDGTSVTLDLDNSFMEFAISQYGVAGEGRDYPSDISTWSRTVPSSQQGKFLWTKDVTAYTDAGVSKTTTTYGVSYYGTDGNSVEIDTANTFVKYSTQKTSSKPADNTFTLDNPPTLAQGDYLWCLSQTKYVGVDSPLKSYSVSRVGTDGDQGDKGPDGYTTHFAYATSADGSQNFSTSSFAGATYIGTYRDQEAADSETYTDYTWTQWKGDKGDSALIADLTNEMDSVAMDASGKVLSQTTLTTTFKIYYGSTAQTLTSLTPSGAATGVTVSCDITTDATKGIVTIVVAANATLTNDKNVITLTGVCAKGTRTAEFTISGVRSGNSGVTPTLFNILPFVDSIKRDKDNTLTPSSITCTVQKVHGTTVSTAAAADGTLRYNVDGDITASDQGTELALGGTVNYTSSNSYITFAYFVGTTMRDKERVPIVYDGADGDGAAEVYVSPGSITVPCNNSGSVVAQMQQRLSLSMYVGNKVATISSVTATCPTGVSVAAQGTSTKEVTITTSATADGMASGIVFTVVGTVDSKEYTATATVPLIGSKQGEYAAEAFVTPASLTILCENNGTVSASITQGLTFAIRVGTHSATVKSVTTGTCPTGVTVVGAATAAKVVTIDTTATDTGIGTGVEFTVVGTYDSKDYTAKCTLALLGARKGQSIQGETGAMYYPAGIHNPNAPYEVTSKLVPIVCSGSSYYYAKETVPADRNIQVTNAKYWGAFSNFAAVFTEILFASFSKLGSFIISGDWFISQYGTLYSASGTAVSVTSTRTQGSVYMKDVTMYGSTKKVPYYAATNDASADMPCYTYFKDDDPRVEGYGISSYPKFRPILAIDALTGDSVMGNTYVEGTVKATNFYHSVCISGLEQYAYCSQLFIDTWSLDDDTQEYMVNFTVGKYYTESEVRSLSGNQLGINSTGMVKCSYSSDIYVIPSSYYDTGGVEVFLPLATDFDGKLVEIIDTRYTQPSTSNYVGGLVVKQCDHGNAMKPTFGANPTDQVRLNASQSHDGGSYRLLSYGGYWVRLSTIGNVS